MDCSQFEDAQSLSLVQISKRITAGYTVEFVDEAGDSLGVPTYATGLMQNRDALLYRGRLTRIQFGDSKTARPATSCKAKWQSKPAGWLCYGTDPSEMKFAVRVSGDPNRKGRGGALAGVQSVSSSSGWAHGASAAGGRASGGGGWGGGGGRRRSGLFGSLRRAQKRSSARQDYVKTRYNGSSSQAWRKKY